MSLEHDRCCDLLDTGRLAGQLPAFRCSPQLLQRACDRPALHSLLIDPAQVWQPGLRPFVNDGDPAYKLERSCVEEGLPVLRFPFVSQGYVVHRGRDTLASVHARGEDTNRLYQWATTHHEAHFELIPGAAETQARLLDEFNDMVGIVDAEHLVPAREPDV